MPRSGPLGTYTLPGAQKTQQPNTTIPSAVNNQGYADIEQTFNTIQPVPYGGTGASTAGGAADALSPAYVNVASGATTNIGAATSPNVNITGTATVTAFDTVAAGITRYVRASGVFTLTHSAALLLPANGANITTAANDTFTAKSLGSGNWIVTDYQRASGQPVIPPALPGFLFGLGLTNNPTDAANDIDVSSGQASSDAAIPVLLVLPTQITKRIDALWVVGNNNGGLDTGSPANTTYYVWLIQRSDTSVTDVLFSASATAPTMPANYDRKRIIGQFVRTGGVNGVPQRYTTSQLTQQWADTKQGLVKLLGGSVTAVAMLDIPLASGFSAFEIHVSLLPVTNATALRMRTSTDGGVTFNSGASDYRWRFIYQGNDGAFGSSNGSNADSFISVIGQVVSNSANAGSDTRIYLDHPMSATKSTKISTVSEVFTDSSTALGVIGGSRRITAEVTNALRLYFSTGNIASGTYEVYGYV